MRSVSTETLRKLLSYNPETGIFTRPCGKVAGCVDKSKGGYIRISLTLDVGVYVTFYAHRLAWQYVMGTEPAEYIDHINNVRSDNRFCNLRPANATENQRNYTKPKNNSSGYKGVSYCKLCRKWKASIRTGGGKREVLGYFASAIDAHQAYKKRNHEVFGSFAHA